MSHYFWTTGILCDIEEIACELIRTDLMLTSHLLCITSHSFLHERAELGQVIYMAAMSFHKKSGA